MTKLVGAMVVKEKSAPARRIDEPVCIRVVSVGIVGALLAHEGGLTGVKCAPRRQRQARSGGRHERAGAELASIHVGVSVISAVVYLV